MTGASRSRGGALRVGLDLRPLQTSSGRRGVGTYARHLVRALRRVVDPGEELIGFVSAGRPRDGIEAELLDDLAPVPGPARAITLLDPLRLVPLLRRRGIDVYHSLFYAPPVRRPPSLKVVQTVHDLTPLLFPAGFTARQRMIFRTTFALAARADRVLAVSENTRRDLDRLAAIPPARVEVIHPGVDDAFRAPAPEPAAIDETCRRLGVGRPYVLHVGGFDEVKNLPVALAVLLRLRRAGLPHGMAVAGEPGTREPAFRREVEGFALQDAVRATGWVGGEDLRRLYHGADLMLYPSRYEGFGLPPLEAMACGTPVVAAAAGSLPEVLGDACPLLDPADPDGMAREARRLLEDPRARDEAIARGRDRSGRYRWDLAGRRTLDLYRRLAAGRAAAAGPVP